MIFINLKKISKFFVRKTIIFDDLTIEYEKFRYKLVCEIFFTRERYCPFVEWTIQRKKMNRWLSSLASNIIITKSRHEYLFSLTLTGIICGYLSTSAEKHQHLFFFQFSLLMFIKIKTTIFEMYFRQVYPHQGWAGSSFFCRMLDIRPNYPARLIGYVDTLYSSLSIRSQESKCIKENDFFTFYSKNKNF